MKARGKDKQKLWISRKIRIIEFLFENDFALRNQPYWLLILSLPIIAENSSVVFNCYGTSSQQNSRKQQ